MNPEEEEKEGLCDGEFPPPLIWFGWGVDFEMFPRESDFRRIISFLEVLFLLFSYFGF